MLISSDFEMDNLDLINMDVKNIGEGWENKFDTVIMNPPFGTKHNKGLDMLFLQTGISLASRAVYSLHKTSTREHVLKKAKDWKVSAQGMFSVFALKTHFALRPS